MDTTADLELSVTICSWNTASLLEECLLSLEAVRSELSFEVIVVDNGSKDRSVEVVRERFPWVRLFALERNLGFTGGQNFAIAKCRSPRVLLLNSDAAVHPGALRALVEFSKGCPSAGIVGPKILNPDGSLQPSCRRFPNPTAALFRNTVLGKLFPKNRFTRDYLMQDWAHDSPREVDWVSGAAMLVTEKFLELVGPMDEAFFMYCEDVDWCWRCWKAGLKVMYFPGAIVTHAIGRSTDQAANRMILRFHRSMLRFYAKNMLPEKPALVRPILFLAAALALAARAGIFIIKNKVDRLRRGARR
jgi:GT2 family glycosyltransferase